MTERTTWAECIAALEQKGMVLCEGNPDPAQIDRCLLVAIMGDEIGPRILGDYFGARGAATHDAGPPLPVCTRCDVSPLRDRGGGVRMIFVGKLPSKD